MPSHRFAYSFLESRGERVDYTVDLDETTLLSISPAREDLPEWTRLEFQQCEHCPLAAKRDARCPVAVSIAGVVEAFANKISHDLVTVTVEVPERTYEKKVSLQHGLCSLLGLLMATSGCPHMDFLRPLARFHLPFASATETLMRTVSVFLLRSYFQASGGKVDVDLVPLEQAYHDVKLVNRGIARRIQSFAQGDADANALVSWHAVASLLMRGFANDLAEIRRLLSIGSSAPACGAVQSPDSRCVTTRVG
jgi:hypothetical protein